MSTLQPHLAWAGEVTSDLPPSPPVFPPPPPQALHPPPENWLPAILEALSGTVFWALFPPRKAPVSSGAKRRGWGGRGGRRDGGGSTQEAQHLRKVVPTAQTWLLVPALSPCCCQVAGELAPSLGPRGSALRGWVSHGKHGAPEPKWELAERPASSSLGSPAGGREQVAVGSALGAAPCLLPHPPAAYGRDPQGQVV